MTKKKRVWVKKDIKVKVVLGEIKSFLQQIKQWSEHTNTDWKSREYKYAVCAECLIELLETHLFGQHCGFNGDLEQRYENLLDCHE